MSTTDDTNAARRGSGSNDLLGQAPTRAQVNAWMADAGWQNSAIRQADLDKVERVVRAAVAAERKRWRQWLCLRADGAVVASPLTAKALRNAADEFEA